MEDKQLDYASPSTPDPRRKNLVGLGILGAVFGLGCVSNAFLVLRYPGLRDSILYRVLLVAWFALWITALVWPGRKTRR